MNKSIRFMFVFAGVFLQSFLFAGTNYSTAIKRSEEPIFKAIYNRDLRQVAEIIDSEQNIEERTQYGYTPLMAAAHVGDLEIVSFLLDQGASVHAKDYSYDTPIMFTLFDSPDRSEVLQYLIDHGADVNTMDSSERTPLILASLNNHVKAIKILLNNGAFLELKGSGKTPFLHAVENGSVGAVRILQEAGAYIEMRDSFGFSALMIAAFKNDGQMIEELVGMGVKIDAQTSKEIPVRVKEGWNDWNPKTRYIPIGSTALDIARQFECGFAEHILQRLSVD